MNETNNDNTLNLLSTREGFNLALRHFKRVLAFSSDIEEGENPADLLNEALDEREIRENQIKPIVNSLLIQKFGYQFKSHNLIETVTISDQMIDSLNLWTAIDFVLLYFNPSGEISIINPKNRTKTDQEIRLVKDELIVCYAGAAEESIPDSTLKSAAADFIRLLYGEEVPLRDDYRSGRAPQTVPEPQKPVQVNTSPGKRRVTTKYGVQVTNEVFHNGNVEAWKKIIESYTSSHRGTEILVWYEDEKINDINALFKWGKVKHGCPIMFSVAGEDIRDVSKLKKYLFEGASPRFEAFLKGAVGSVLDLF